MKKILTQAESAVTMITNLLLSNKKCHTMTMVALLLGFVVAALYPMTIYASGVDFNPPPVADGLFGQLANWTFEWVAVVGTIVVGVGAIFFGLGWVQQDASGKVLGLRIMVGGGIVAGVGMGITIM